MSTDFDSGRLPQWTVMITPPTSASASSQIQSQPSEGVTGSHCRELCKTAANCPQVESPPILPKAGKANYLSNYTQNQKTVHEIFQGLE